MAQPMIQASFNAGEYAPALYARVDLAKYHSAAALLRNFFVDYRGGASTRPGTQYILQCYKSSTAVRLIPFQASFIVDYVLEFGDKYLRFFNSKAPILESAFPISVVSNSNPATVTTGALVAASALPINLGVSSSYAPGELLTPAGGTFTLPAQLRVNNTQVLSLNVASPGSLTFGGYGYQTGDIITLGGGTPVAPAQIQVSNTKVINATLYNGGSGGTPGPAVLTGLTGTGRHFTVNVTIGSSGAVTSVGSIVDGGSYTVDPLYFGSPFFARVDNMVGGGTSAVQITVQMGINQFSIINPGNYSANPAGGNATQAASTGSGTGATFSNLLMGPISLSIANPGAYTVAPANPVTQASSTGTGTGLQFTLNFQGGANYSVGDWIYIAGVAGATQVNNNYYTITAVNGGTVTLADLNGNPIDSTAFGAYTSGGTTARVYTISTPYAAADLQLLKFAQNVNSLIICHPSYPPQVLTLIAANNWTLLPINFGTSITPPASVSATSTLGAGSVNYSYLVTAVDGSGQESGQSAAANLANKTDLASTAGTNKITWSSVIGAASYNIYKSDVSYFGVIPPGVPYGFIGNSTGQELDDSNIAPNFSLTPPIYRNPFQGAGLSVINVTAPGMYTTVPTVTLSGATSVQVGSAAAILQVQGTPGIASAGTGYAPGDQVTYSNGVVVVVGAVGSGGAVTNLLPINNAQASPGSVSSGNTPTNPLAQLSTSGAGTGLQVNLIWGVGVVQVINGGAGYTSVPAVVFSSGSATATAVLGAASNGYPSVPCFFQQRLVLAAQAGAPQTLNFSQPGSYYNFNVSSPIQADDAISATLSSGQLNTIKSIVPSAAGLITLTDKASWLINGGSAGSAISPSGIVANVQSFNGASDLPPIVSNYDYLYVQAKGSIVRDSAYNFYANVFTGTDISVQSSHLFYGYQLLEWAWAEEPFKVVWAVRNDGVMLTLTFQKEQDFIGWSHSDTQGLFKSVATIVEAAEGGSVDAIYTVVQRVVGGKTVKYIERVAERLFKNGAVDAWCVDAALQFVGAPAMTFSGMQHLAGLTVTGLADGKVIPPFTMPASGTFNLTTAASKVTVGLPFIAQLKTLAIDTGEPTIQGKVKQIPQVTVRLAEALGLQIGATFGTLVTMKDLVVGNVGSASNQIVTDLVTADAKTVIDATYTVPGQFCIQQSLPYPATILGVIPQLAPGDTAR